MHACIIALKFLCVGSFLHPGTRTTGSDCFQVRSYTYLKIVAGGCDRVDAEGETAVVSAAPERSHLLAIKTHARLWD
jgi:hypothetical protein